MDKLLELLQNNTSDKGSFFIEYCSNRDSYFTVEEYINENISRGYVEDDFLNCDYIKKAIKNDIIIELKWYKNTPVKYIYIAGSCFNDIYQQCKKYK